MWRFSPPDLRSTSCGPSARSNSIQSSLTSTTPTSQALLAKRVAHSVGPANTVITDVGHVLMASVLEAIRHTSPSTKRLAYYENPEPFVPGGYSKTAEKVMAAANKVLFSNANLAKEPLYSAPESLIALPMENRVGIGYYPIESARALESARTLRKEAAKAKFFEERKIQNTGQKSWFTWEATTKRISKKPSRHFSKYSENRSSILPNILS